MAAQAPLSGLLFLSRLMRTQTLLWKRRELQQIHTSSRAVRTFSTSPAKNKDNEGKDADSSPLSTRPTLKQTLQSRRRPLSPLERISSMLPQDALSPEVMQLREQDQQDPEDGTNIQDSFTKEGSGHVDPDPHHGSDEAEDTLSAPQTLPGENLLTFGEYLVAEYRGQGLMESRRMFQLRSRVRLESMWGVIKHDDIEGHPAGSFFKTSQDKSIFIRRASLEDYVVLMRRGPAISYPKDAAAMLMMMDVTEGDCVLESGSGSGAMTLFLSRAVGSKGRVLSVEVREDHQKRAILNYKHWRAAWSLRRGEEWPDNVQFVKADLSRASALLRGQGFHSIALDLIHPQLVLSTVTPHLHPGAVCAVYLANITQVTDLLEGLRCVKLPLLCESIIEVPVRDWLVAPALHKDGRYCRSRKPIQTEDQREEEEAKVYADEGEEPAFGRVAYIARPHPEQKGHTAFLVKLRKCVE